MDGKGGGKTEPKETELFIAFLKCMLCCFVNYLCYVTLCLCYNVMLCCYAMLRYAMLRYAMWLYCCYIILHQYYITLYYVYVMLLLYGMPGSLYQCYVYIGLLCYTYHMANTFEPKLNYDK